MTGLYELPGGNLEFGEDIFASIKREVLEETGLKIVPKKIIAYTNDIQKEEEKHEVTLYVLSEREDSSQQPEVRTSRQHSIQLIDCNADNPINGRPRSPTRSRAGSGRPGRRLRPWGKLSYICPR